MGRFILGGIMIVIGAHTDTQLSPLIGLFGFLGFLQVKRRTLWQIHFVVKDVPILNVSGIL
jgi:hypothetical protein